ncbi:ATP-binding protein [Cellulomonas sp. zg-ZUI22]|uniref:sensor histidine kinase n=1 Tax=Cellulomonas sp. zg-ZUI22 TaxID=2816955 RepID=UPI001A946E5E|nr:histidine kinase [Cellulomonas sp. zg-ZUI22]MBO0899736.1 ATP-binding protein [Cellulomonas sp. zg-ZUI22]
MTGRPGFHHRLVSAAMFVRLGAIVVALFGMVGQQVTPVLLICVLVLAGPGFAVLVHPPMLDAVTRHPLVLVVDVLINLGLVAALGVESPLVLATFSSALLVGMLTERRAAVAGALILAAGYVVVRTLATDGRDQGFMLALGVPTLYLCLVGLGAAVRRAHAEQASLHAQTQAAQRALVAADERARLAREMHDSVGKTLHGIALGARGLVGWVDRDPARAAELARALGDAAEDAAREAREILVRLRADQPDRPLVEVLRDRCEAWQAETGIPCELVVRFAVDLPTEVRYEVLAIVGEALENVRRHAGASHVTVELAATGDACRIVVADDGQGFAPRVDGTSPHGHFGLTGMHERAREAGVRLAVSSRPGAGTRVEIVHATSGGRAPQSGGLVELHG